MFVRMTVYNNIVQGIGKSLFAGDEAMQKRGRNVEYVVRQLQETIKSVEQWSLEWGFTFSVEKTKTLFFTRKKNEADFKLIRDLFSAKHLRSPILPLNHLPTAHLALQSLSINPPAQNTYLMSPPVYCGTE